MNNKNENIGNEELKKIAPTLFGMEKVNNLKAPNGYFSNLSSSIKNKLNEGIPTDYFESLADNIVSKIEIKETKVISINKTRRYRFFAITASIAAIFVLVFLLNNSTTEVTTMVSNSIEFEDLTVEEFENEIYTSETENLICYIDFEDENDLNIETEYDFNDTDLELTSDEIDDYLSSDYYFDVEF